MKSIITAIAVVASAGAVASATPVLQFDVNQFAAQAGDGAGAPSAFGGTNHTGSVNFSYSAGITVLNGIFIQSTNGGPFNNANFAGFSLTNFAGSITMTNGQVTGGSIAMTLDNADTYTCNITPNSGGVSTFVGGGFKIEALTRGGQFNDSQFGNVDVSPWFGAQNGLGLPGALLQFNFDPNAQGFATSDMDLFVDVVPLPPAAWAGMATLAGAMLVRRLRRR